MAICGVIFIAAGIMLLFSAPASAPSKPKEPLRAGNPLNVVLIVSDALREDHVLGTRDGQPLMPYVSTLAAKSLYFAQAATQCTWTRPSMTTVLTSLYPETHQVYFDADPEGIRTADTLSDSIETMSSYLKRAGYQTLCVQTNGNLSAKLGYAQGFDSYDYLPDAASEVVTAKAKERLETVTQPYFLYVHYMDPHVPYMPPERYRKKFNDMTMPDADRKQALDFLPYLLEHSAAKFGKKTAMTRPLLSEQGKEGVCALYDADARYVDDELQKLMAALPNPDRTLVVFMSDHGETLWEHDHLGHGLTCFQEVVHIPLLFHGPGIMPQTRPEPVEAVSILPTVAAILGLPPNPAWQGVNLMDTADTSLNKPVFSWTTGPWQSMNIELNSVRVGDWKIIIDDKTGQQTLFNLKDDPKELKDLAAERPDIAIALHNLLDAHRKSAVEARNNRARQSVELDPDTSRELEQIGYKRQK